jgi:hypothetical protein
MRLVPVVPVVPVCTYAHAREGRYAFAERVKKNTGTKWDRDQTGCASEALANFPTQQANERTSGFLSPFLGPLKITLMHVCSRRNLVWDDKQVRLYSIRGRVLAAIEPDREWPGMWRVRMPDGRLTDMLNLSRAKDAAASLALAVPNRHQEAA